MDSDLAVLRAAYRIKNCDSQTFQKNNGAAAQEISSKLGGINGKRVTINDISSFCPLFQDYG